MNVFFFGIVCAKQNLVNEIQVTNQLCMKKPIVHFKLHCKYVKSYKN